MYRIEEFKNRTPMKAYIKIMKMGKVFWDTVKRKRDMIKFGPVRFMISIRKDIERNINIFILSANGLFFEQTADERYVNQVCLEEKENLTKKIKNLKKSHPDSLAVSAGSCHVCSWCRRAEGRGCRYSDDIRRFIEFIGGNAGETAGEVLAIEMKWMKQKLPESLTLINGLLTNDPRIEF